jgi:ubiquinone/menaquinone biosynthesis C-methylase UbiE
MHHHQLFSYKPDIYASSRPTYPDGLFNFLSECCQMRDLAWDCGCGNGQAAIGLAEHFTRVEATDVSAEQIAHAKVKERVNYSVSPAEKTQFEDQSVDLICVAQALHWFDYEKYWTEVSRVLKSNGIFAAFGYSWFTVETTIDREIKSSILEVIEPYWAKQNKLLWDHYRDVSIPFTKLSTPNFPMITNWNLTQLFAYIHSWSATRRCMETLGDAFFMDAFQRVSEVWGDLSSEREVKMDFCLIVSKNEG